ncbi:MAG: hypothetical protein LBU32_04055 [Clostridiales bacterium]|nr:hypothetical protein [Clostridiales bacterium]
MPRNPLAVMIISMDERFFNNEFYVFKPIDSAKRSPLFIRAGLPSACISSSACANIVQRATVLAH